MPVSPSKGHSGRGPGSSVCMPPPQRHKQLSSAWIANLTPGKPTSQHFQRLEPGPRFILLFLGEMPSLDGSQEAHPGTNWSKSRAATATPRTPAAPPALLSRKFQLLPRGWKNSLSGRIGAVFNSNHGRSHSGSTDSVSCPKHVINSVICILVLEN